jgi:coenzyme F420-reducing hydrogenase alpha subunit
MSDAEAGGSRIIKVDYLARVEGEGALLIRLKDGAAEDVQLRIFEPPRFFEALLRGRSQLEAPDITSRICGICPVAYQLTACLAVEDAHGIQASEPVRALRRLIYCGEWLESHALHVFMLHAPDFLGYPDAFAMSRDHPELVKDGLRLKKAGNALIALLGGREIHPINVRVGGFFRAPRQAELAALLPELRACRDVARAVLEGLSRLPFPDFERDYEFVALSHPEDYPFCEGRIVSSKGLDLPVRDFDRCFAERQVPHSAALQASVIGRGAYLCGPLARFNLNFERLRPAAKEAARQIGLEVPCRNPFKSILVRGVEILHACDEAIRLIETYAPPAQPACDVPVAAGTGYGCTEAPRGLLVHRYDLGADGLIATARIVPPTSQNQRAMEEDLAALAPRLAALDHAQATGLAERAVRNFDPCISCATHFLQLRA